LAGKHNVFRTLVWTSLVAGLCWTGPAHAQLALSFPTEPPANLMRDALASTYGNALLDEFTNSAGKAADPACLQGRALDAVALKERGRDLFQRWGSRSVETLTSSIDRNRYDSELAARAGKGAAREIEQLRKSPDVQRYLAMERPARAAKALDFTIEQFERYLLVQRFKLIHFHPARTANGALMRLNPIEATEQALDRFVMQRKSRPLNRFLELSETADEAWVKAIDPEFAKNWGSWTFYRGVETDLAEICIMPRA
jgi:hypothetical protein